MSVLGIVEDSGVGAKDAGGIEIEVVGIDGLDVMTDRLHPG